MSDAITWTMEDFGFGLLGKRIVALRKLTKQELDDEGWEPSSHNQCVALVLDDGTILFASKDEEGNGPGEIFTRTKDGTTGMLWIPKAKK
jgi:hypothetical protein